jgi:hypothetical protein
VALSLNNLAVLYYVQGRYAETEPLCKRVVKISEDKLGPHHPNTVLFKKNLKACQDAMQGRDSTSPIQEPKGLLDKFKKFFKRG